ncbi:MAG: sulfotransferase [Methylococcales bacterium]
MSKPNFFIVGAPKCGTTALSEYLRSHPNVFMCSPKEPFYFATDFPVYSSANATNIEEYLDLFSTARNKQYAIGEASAIYLYSKTAIPNIREFAPDAKIIVMLRNPVDLAYSIHSQNCFGKSEDENNFIKAWGLIEKRKRGVDVPSRCRDRKMLYYDDIARLGDQFERLINLVPTKNILTIFSEDFFSDTKSTYKKVINFLELPDDNKDVFVIYNQNKTHKIGWLGVFTQRPPKWMVNIAMWLKSVIGLRYFGLLKSIRGFNVVNSQRKTLPVEFRQKVIECYRNDIYKLSELTGRDLSDWLELK